jgi:hypothetical protein
MFFRQGHADVARLKYSVTPYGAVFGLEVAITEPFTGATKLKPAMPPDNSGYIIG